MSYTLTIEEHGVYCVFNNSLTSEAFINFNHSISKISKPSVFKYKIINLTNVASFPIEFHAIKAVAKQDAKIHRINPNIKLAVVANSAIINGFVIVYRSYFDLEGNVDHKKFGLVRNTTPQQIEVFKTDEEAREWVNA